MHHGRAKALHSIRTATLAELLAEGWLDRAEHAPRTRIPCSDEHPQPVHPGDYAECLRCELIACQDPRQTIRRGSTVEVCTEVQIYVDSWRPELASTA